MFSGTCGGIGGLEDLGDLAETFGDVEELEDPGDLARPFGEVEELEDPRDLAGLGGLCTALSTDCSTAWVIRSANSCPLAACTRLRESTASKCLN